MRNADSHFVPGFLVGAAVGIIFCGALYITGPKVTYDRVLDETGADLIRTAGQLDGCTAAYVASHGGKLPRGMLVQGKGTEDD